MSLSLSSRATNTACTSGPHQSPDRQPTTNKTPGIAVSSTGRKFTCYPGGLDPTNVNQGIPGIYTVGEITSPTTEVAYPNISYNTPPGGAVDYTTVPPKTKGLSNYLLGVQSVVVDELDTLWILDTGRVISLSDPLHAMLASQPGGPKLIAVNITSNTVMRTYTFPADVALPYSYLNDVRFDRSPSLSGINGTKGVAYVCISFAFHVLFPFPCHRRSYCSIPSPFHLLLVQS